MNQRIRPSERRAAPLALSALLCALLAGCASNSPQHHPASLSDAAREAKKPPEQQTPLVAQTPPPPAPEPESEPPPVVAASGGSAHSGRSSDEARPHLGLSIGGGALGGGKLDGFGSVGLQLGAYASDRWRFDLEGVLQDVQFSDESHLGESFKDAIALSFDLSGRWYVTPQHTFLGIYPIGGLRAGKMFWFYANPLTVVDEEGWRTVDTDALGFFAPYVGAGAGLLQLRHVQIGLRGIAGYQLYHWMTREGFSNDLIRNTAFGEIKVEGAYVF